MNAPPKPRILVIDDDPAMRWFMELASEHSAAFESVEAMADGVAAFHRLVEKRGANSSATETPDVILTDLNMPGMSGIKLVEELKKEESTRHIIVFILTLSEAAMDEALAWAAGCDGFFKKPQKFDELVLIVQQLASHWHSRATAMSH